MFEVTDGIATPVPPSRPRVWLEAARPRTLFAALAPVLMGGGLALGDERFRGLPFLAALAAALLLQVGANFANDLSDFLRGADAPGRSGFTRATQAGWVTPGQMRRAAALSFAAALSVGVYLVYEGGWPILVIGVAAISAGLAYTGGPWPFGYHGLGDLVVFVFFGWVAVGGTYYVQSGVAPPDVWLAGAGVGSLVTAILVVNNLRDLPGDARAGKRTLAVRVGPRATRVEYTALLLAGAAVPPLGILLLGWMPWVLAAWVAFGLAVRPLRSVWTFVEPASLNAALAQTARVAGTYGILFAIGSVL